MCVCVYVYIYERERSLQPNDKKEFILKVFTVYTHVSQDFLKPKFQLNIRGSHHMQDTNFVCMNWLQMSIYRIFQHNLVVNAFNSMVNINHTD